LSRSTWDCGSCCHPLTLLGGGKGKKGTVGAKAGEKAGKALLTKILKKLLLKVTRTLVKLGLKVTGWTLPRSSSSSPSSP